LRIRTGCRRRCHGLGVALGLDVEGDGVGVGVGVGLVGEGDGVGDGVGPVGEGDGVGEGIGVGVGTGPVGEGVVPVGDDGGVDAGPAGAGLIGDGTRVPLAVAMILGSATVPARAGELARAVGALASVLTTGVGVVTGVGVASSGVVAPVLGSGICGGAAVGSDVASRPRRLSTPVGAGLAQSVPGSLRPARARPMHPPLASTATSTPTATRGAVGRG
jgi:hypothetical protein